MAQDIFEERKELTQLLIDAHIMYGDKFVKEFTKMIEKKFPMNIKTETTMTKDCEGQLKEIYGLRVVQKAESTPVLEEETA
jgi:uncharacterized protein with PhoU and TrkA domain